MSELTTEELKRDTDTMKRHDHEMDDATRRVLRSQVQDTTRDGMVETIDMPKRPWWRVW